jgi:hypothetical protein
MKHVAWVSAVTAMMLLGCSSGDSQPAAAGSGGSAPDAGGSGGGAGTADGGAGTAGSSGGAGAGGQGGAAGHGGGPPTGAFEQCTANWTPVCKAWEQCIPTFFAFNFADQADCVQSRAQFCVAAQFADGSKATLEELKACGDALPSPLSCDAVIQSLVESIVPAQCEGVPGTRENGQPCGALSQCKSQYCNLPAGAVCGKCDTVAQQGEDCTEKMCKPGLVCVGATCTVPGKEGDSCGALTAPCLSSLGCSAGKCVPQLSVGDSCNPADVLVCGYDHFCNTTTQKCGVFTNNRTVGQTCGVLSDGTYDACVRGAVCRITNANEYTGLCDTAAKQGDECDDSVNYMTGTRCSGGTICVAGICTKFEPGKCN